MQANYPRKYPRVHRDNLNVEYPVRVCTKDVASSEATGHQWRPLPEVFYERSRDYIDDIKQYSRDYTLCNELKRSLTSLGSGYKIPDVNIFYKPKPCVDNSYIYPPSRKLENQPPACRVQGTTETKDSYIPPVSGGRFVCDNNQFNHPISLESNPIPIETSWQKELKPLDTTYEGYEKYLDPYLTTSRLHHRPFTAEQLNKISNSRDIFTYYTLADVPWAWTRKPKHEEWLPRVQLPKSMHDREKFKGDFREIRTHNRLQWVPGSFRTEVKDNYGVFSLLSNLPKEKHEEDIGTLYKRGIAKLNTSTLYKNFSKQGIYSSENSVIGSRKPICTVFEQCVKRK